MKLSISTKLAFKIALKIAVSAFLVLECFFVVNIFSNFIFSSVLFIGNFLMIKFSVKNLLRKRVKPIYSTLYDYSMEDKDLLSLDDIEQDAVTWKKNKEKSIIDLQSQINFRKEFLGNISHELKTPLFSIRGYVDTLLDGGLDDENINKAYLKKTSKNIDRLSNIITDLDTISKVESNALKLKKEAFDINELILDVQDYLEFLADKKDIEIVYSELKNKIEVNADRASIREVLINLVSNSLKYGKEQGETTITIHDIENKILIRIHDNGMGIKKEQLPRIFERFYRIDDNRSREQGGSGLGLAIVKHLIEAHQQKINVQSEFGIGSTFEFTLDKIV